jgi:hypothetical protein
MLKFSRLILQLSEFIGMGGVVIILCVKNIIACTELWVDDDFEMTAVERERNIRGKLQVFKELHMTICWRMKDQQPVTYLREI